MGLRTGVGRSADAIVEVVWAGPEASPLQRSQARRDQQGNQKIFLCRAKGTCHQIFKRKHAHQGAQAHQYGGGNDI